MPCPCGHDLSSGCRLPSGCRLAGGIVGRATEVVRNENIGPAGQSPSWMPLVAQWQEPVEPAFAAAQPSRLSLLPFRPDRLLRRLRWRLRATELDPRSSPGECLPGAVDDSQRIFYLSGMQTAIEGNQPALVPARRGVIR